MQRACKQELAHGPSPPPVKRHLLFPLLLLLCGRATAKDASRRAAIPSTAVRVEILNVPGGNVTADNVVRALAQQVADPAARGKDFGRFLAKYDMDPNVGLPHLKEFGHPIPLETAAPVMQLHLHSAAPTVDASWDMEEPVFADIEVVRPVLLKADAKCLSGHSVLRPQPSLQLCAEAVVAGMMASGGRYLFSFGKDSNNGRCYVEYALSETCPDGFQEDAVSFYKARIERLRAVQQRSDVACATMTAPLGSFDTFAECAKAAAAAGRDGFLFGKGLASGQCLVGRGTNSCQDGFVEGVYDFFHLMATR